MQTRKTAVAFTGAGGAIGRVIRPGLLARGIDLRSIDIAPIEPLDPSEAVLQGDLRDPATVDRAFEGRDIVLHLAGTSVERPLPEIIDNNLRALHEVFEGARRHRIRRVVFASSNHAFGMHEAGTRLELDAPYRPDSLYGLSKVWGEAMARLYWDKHGIEAISLRIGSAAPRPTEERHLSTWLGEDDMMRLVTRCIEVETIGCLAVWGVSNNTRRWWSNDGAGALGYRPIQDAEDYADEILRQPRAAALARRYQGGSFAAADNTRAEREPQG